MAKEPRERLLSEIFLDKWSATRGPLFDEPAAAVCRILAVCAAHRARREATDRVIRIRAARVLDEALRVVPDSNLPATNETRARVNMALVDVNRLLREAPPDEGLVTPLAKILARASAREVDEIEVLRIFALAELLAAALEADTWEVRLRAARTLIARTRDAARRVGRASSEATDASPKTPPAEEVVHEHVHVQVHDSDPRSTAQTYECRSTGPP
ncbi:MAG: hypothetical protein KDH09_14865 [Chrysiogenetes bacterium]|nr:hypothetical protein [Chrysiogenetes bacterium]